MHLLEDALLHVVGHAGLLDASAEVLVLLASILELDELLADGAQLFAEDVLTLGVVDRLLDVLVNLAAKLSDLALTRQQRDQRAQARDDVGLLEECHAVFEAEIGAGAGDVRDQARLRSPCHRHGGVGRDLRPRVHVIGEQRSHGSGQRVDLGTGGDVDRQRCDRREPCITRRIEGVDADSLLPLDQRMRAAAGQAPEGADVRDDCNGVHVVDRRLVASRVALDRQHDPAVAVDRCVEGSDRPGPAGGKRGELRREHHVVTQRDRGQRQRRSGSGVGRIGGLGLLLGHEASIAGAQKHQTSIPSPCSQSRRHAAA